MNERHARLPMIILIFHYINNIVYSSLAGVYIMAHVRYDYSALTEWKP